MYISEAKSWHRRHLSNSEVKVSTQILCLYIDKEKRGYRDYCFYFSNHQFQMKSLFFHIFNEKIMDQMTLCQHHKKCHQSCESVKWEVTVNNLSWIKHQTSSHSQSLSNSNIKTCIDTLILQISVASAFCNGKMRCSMLKQKSLSKQSELDLKYSL